MSQLEKAVVLIYCLQADYIFALGTRFKEAY